MRDFRLAGDAHYNNYIFGQALIAYERALTYVSRQQTPQLWAATLIDIGRANWELGIRAEGLAIGQYLSAAVKAYHQALEVYTREQLPQDWAMTQNNLGAALREPGHSHRRGGGRPLAGARPSLPTARPSKCCTREQLPQDWAMTQNNLGTALQDQGIRTGGEAGAHLLAEAVTAYRQALEVLHPRAAAAGLGHDAEQPGGCAPGPGHSHRRGGRRPLAGRGRHRLPPGPGSATPASSCRSSGP